MRVLCLATEFPPARGYGLARYVAAHTSALAGQGLTVDVACNNWDAGNSSYHADGVEVNNAPYVIPFKGYDWLADVLQHNVLLLGRAIEMCRRNGPYDILQVHDWLGASAAKAIKANYRLPLVVSIHDTAVGKRFGQLDATHQYIADVERWLCGLADRVLANSEFTRNELVQAYDVPDGKIDVVFAGVSPAAFETDSDVPLFKTLFCPAGERLVAFVGRLAHEKGPHILLEAIPNVLAVRPGTHFVFAGDGAMRETLERRARELGIAQHVRFTGHLAGKVLATFYHAADVVVVPSLYEPLGMVALEAMACGRPVVATQTGGLMEIAEAGQNAVTVPPNAPRELASALAQLLFNPSAAAQIGTQARQGVMAKWRWDMVAERTVRAYEHVLALPVPGRS